ncbi:hypothetical protein L195_g054206, partial [Trifolium pratense]
GEAPKFPPSGKLPQKHLLSKPNIDNRSRKESLTAPSKSGAASLNRSVAHDHPVQASSRFSGGSVLCCSSIKTADIIHYNEKIRKQRESEVASKLWNSTRKFGVGSEDDCEGESVFIQKIIEGVKSDRDAKAQREQKSRNLS